MKKIMFNDKYGLTQAVLEGRKTMTRRLIPDKEQTRLNSFYGGDDWNYAVQTCIDDSSRFDIGEEVAVAQSYSELSWDSNFYDKLKSGCELLPQYELKGWDNKMFVKSELMPHYIRITNIKVERLQDISEEDCIKEGVFHSNIDESAYCVKGIYEDKHRGFLAYFYSPRKAFSALIDKVSGKGTWESNPWVFVYEFELLNS